MPLYHVSREVLAPGTVLQSRFGTDQNARRVYEIVFSALREGDWAVKSLLLADAVVAARLRSTQFGAGQEPAVAMYLKEAVFENIRRSEFAELPARLGGFFLCPTLEDATRFQKSMTDRPHIHVCELHGGTQAELDLTLVSTTGFLAPIEEQLQELTDRARRYWKGDKSEDAVMEIVTSGKVTITGSVTP